MKDIIKAVKDMGCSAHELKSKNGSPNLLVGVNGIGVTKTTLLWQTKKKKEQMTIDEIIWHDEWKGQVQIVDSVEKAIACINYVRKGK